MWYALICEVVVPKSVGENTDTIILIHEMCRPAALLAKTNSCALGQHLHFYSGTSGDKNYLAKNYYKNAVFASNTAATMCVCPWLTVTVCRVCAL